MFPFTLKPDFLNYLLIVLHNIEIPTYVCICFSKINVENNNEVHGFILKNTFRISYKIVNVLSKKSRGGGGYTAVRFCKNLAFNSLGKQLYKNTFLFYLYVAIMCTQQV